MLIRSFLFLLLSGILFFSCDKYDERQESGDPARTKGEITFEINITPPTRVSTGKDFTCVWEDGDEIGLFGVSYRGGQSGVLQPADNYIQNVKLTYSEADGGIWTPEQPLYFEGDNLIDFYAYYPYDAGITDPLNLLFDVKTDQRRKTGNRQDYALSDLMFAKASDIDKTNYRNTPIFLQFSHRLAQVEVTLDNQNGILDPTKEIIVTLCDVQKQATLSFPSGNVQTTTGNTGDINMYRVEQPGDPDYLTTYTFRAFLPAQELAQGATLFRLVNGGIALKGSQLAAPVILQHGQCVRFNQVLPLSALFPLSEANSYMATPGGQKLLIPVSQANRVLTADALGAVTTGLNPVEKDNFTVELVWGDGAIGPNGVIRSIECIERNNEGYILVEPGVAGNAVIGIKLTGEQEFRWSWHIWVTEPITTGSDPITGLTWMDRNLGAGGAGSWQAGGKNGLFYQWGRKDAFPASDGTYNIQSYYTEASGNTPVNDNPTGDYTELHQLVKYPLHFATNYNTYRGSIVGEGDNNSWGNQSENKTLYDPCPPGWKVPPIQVGGQNVWDNASAWDTWNDNGLLFNGTDGLMSISHYYPAAGNRNCNSGAFNNVGTNGYYWSASPNSTDGYYLFFYSSSVNPANYTSRAYGFSVRCVQE